MAIGISGNNYGNQTGISGGSYSNPLSFGATSSRGATNSMADPVTLGLVGVSAVSGILGSLFGGSDAPPDPNAKELPPELEFEMLNQHEDFIKRSNEAYQKIDSVSKEYMDRLTTIEAGLGNLIPQADIQKRLADSSARLAEQLGLRGEELVKNGFLDPEDVKAMDELKALEGKSSQELVATDDALQRERATLEQSLRQNPGLSKSARDSILRDFDMRAGETVRAGRFERGSSLIGTRATLREQGFNQATTSLGATQSELGRIQGLYGQQAQLAGERYATGVATETTKIGVGQAIQQQFDTLGKYKFSYQAKDALQGGQIGPGSLAFQKGLTSAKGTVGGPGSGLDNLNKISSDSSGRWIESLTRSDVESILNTSDSSLSKPLRQVKYDLDQMMRRGSPNEIEQSRSGNTSTASQYNQRLNSLYNIYRQGNK